MADLNFSWVGDSDQLQTESTGKQRPPAQGHAGMSSLNDPYIMNLSPPHLVPALTNDPRPNEVSAHTLQMLSSSPLLSQAQTKPQQQPIKAITELDRELLNGRHDADNSSLQRSGVKRRSPCSSSSSNGDEIPNVRVV